LLKQVIAMADEPPFVEPTPIICTFVNGTACEFMENFTRIIAWEDRPAFPGEPRQRLIIARWVLPIVSSRILCRELQRGLRRKSN
jgi:hypothetical protein